MALIEFKRDPSAKEVRQFSCYVLPGLCFVLAAWAGYRMPTWTACLALLAAGVASIVLGLVRPRWMRVLFLAWMWAAFPIGWVVSHVMIAAIYFLLITPIGLIMRAGGRDPLGLKFDRHAKTYWTPRPTEVEPSRYFRQF